MGTYIIKRLAQMIPVIFLVSFIVFSLSYFMPGDPVRLLMGQNADPVSMQAKRAELGLDKPFLGQYVDYVWKVAQGDFGISYAKKGMSVTELILEKFDVTLRLALMATFLSIVLGITAGVLSAVKPNSWLDYSAMLGALLGVSAPVFYIGFLLLAFVAPVVGLPTSGYTEGEALKSLLLPALALGALSTAIVARLTRATMLDMLSQDFVRTARAKGLPEATVVLKHTLRNAAIPIITVVGANLGGLLVGAVLTESVFALPGLGREIVGAITQRDRPVIAGGVLFMSFIFLFMNLLVDLTYAWFDPRVRLDR
ncbi:MAG: ABC transporter permease [Planctomycetota bacterium]|jgi:peptide/nickel transport system permease protein